LQQLERDLQQLEGDLQQKWILYHPRFGTFFVVCPTDEKEINILGLKLHSLENCDNISMNPGIVLVEISK